LDEAKDNTDVEDNRGGAADLERRFLGDEVDPVDWGPFAAFRSSDGDDSGRTVCFEGRFRRRLRLDSPPFSVPDKIGCD
jgi:hypothetical protein